MSSSVNEALYNALSTGDLNRALELLDAGANINKRSSDGTSLLAEILLELTEQPELRPRVVRFMLVHGADPRVLDNEGWGPLTVAMIHQDTAVLRLLLEHGADPNRAAGFLPSESFYDHATFDYVYQTYGLELPDQPSDDDRATEDNWLRFCDRLADKYGTRRPDYLYLLREYGALSQEELASRGAL